MGPTIFELWVMETKLLVTKIEGVFGFWVSITHNSKMVGPITEKFVWIFITPFPVFISIIQFSNFWVMSYGNWKHILSVFSFHNFVFNDIFVIKLTTLLLFSCNVWLLGFFFFLKQSPTAYLDFSVFILFFNFLFETEVNGRTKWWVPNGWGWVNWGILSDE